MPEGSAEICFHFSPGLSSLGAGDRDLDTQTIQIQRQTGRSVWIAHNVSLHPNLASQGLKHSTTMRCLGRRKQYWACCAGAVLFVALEPGRSMSLSRFLVQFTGPRRSLALDPTALHTRSAAFLQGVDVDMCPPFSPLEVKWQQDHGMKWHD